MQKIYTACCVQHISEISQEFWSLGWKIQQRHPKCYNLRRVSNSFEMWLLVSVKHKSIPTCCLTFLVSVKHNNIPTLCLTFLVSVKHNNIPTCCLTLLVSIKRNNIPTCFVTFLVSVKYNKFPRVVWLS